MLVIAMETGVAPGGRARWTGRRHDDERADVSSGVSREDLFGLVFGALHDGEQVALGLDCPLAVPLSADRLSADRLSADQGPGAAGGSAATDYAALAEPAASRPGLAELGYLLGELGTWRPWTRVSTSLARWRANTSILVWRAEAAPGSAGLTAGAAVESFFRQLPAARAQAADEDAGTMLNVVAAVARRAGLFVDPAELTRPPVTVTVRWPTGPLAH